MCTLPFPVLRTVEVTPELSHAKRRAIRQLNYHASTKVLFQVRERIWETDDGIDGGATVTDLPVRRLNYPPPDPTTSRGVLLASYTWGQDALQWGAMDEETRLEEALDDVARIHPRIREVYETGASHAWYGDRWARGAFALFAPGQQSELQEDIVRPEGRILFAGEHCSLYHAWIQGALESGIRAARQIHEDTVQGSAPDRRGGRATDRTFRVDAIRDHGRAGTITVDRRICSEGDDPRRDTLRPVRGSSASSDETEDARRRKRVPKADDEGRRHASARSAAAAGATCSRGPRPARQAHRRHGRATCDRPGPRALLPLLPRAWDGQPRWAPVDGRAAGFCR